MVEHAIEVPVGAELGRRETMQFVPQSPAAQEVGVPATHLPGTGAAQAKARAPVFVEPVNFVEQGRELLDLVDDDEGHRPFFRQLGA